MLRASLRYYSFTGLQVYVFGPRILLKMILAFPSKIHGLITRVIPRDMVAHLPLPTFPLQEIGESVDTTRNRVSRVIADANNLLIADPLRV